MMTVTDFEQPVVRRGTASVKWDFMERVVDNPRGELLPMWVSDFDFLCPPAVRTALEQRIRHGVFGYSDRDDAYYQAATDWFARRHGLSVAREWFTSVEGVVPGLALLVQMLTRPGEGVVVQGPWYGSFGNVVQLNQRQLLENPLVQGEDGIYRMDTGALEALFRQQRVPLMILCNPHNPTGRCWSEDELTRLLLLCERYDVTLISDEIWADLLLPGARFTSLLALGERWHSRVICATSASKTFGLSSLRIANFLIPDEGLRNAFQQRLNAHGLDVFNALSLTAATAAWQHGEPWLDQLLAYLADNRRWFCEQAAQRLPWARVTPAQATYLIWMDCRALGLEDSALKQAMVEQAGIVPSMGSSFGPRGQGFIRLNLGCPREYLEQAMDGLARLLPG
ncbi:MalY/PatB family protein [Shimwellia blattae]|uniref:cysteine-S-conjugate beta-lyase n=1 Tax=Shimwellia blattae (strain ATCC 29907 / DSM 4481 / JCM 1650 / NBRC 105725 / CDC 9005-74) TaxID=630626 RepID=I2B5U1_SHIBC|nr:putative aminotransferase [Shimwellia blattae DSM 4481 = NBRC 105725]VDY63373.1 Cystathionine beta-lyase PatB [Shimwellia blattae]VEC21204.1 Cystathionine beta-lyase PatB [Shimwellia blattae]